MRGDRWILAGTILMAVLMMTGPGCGDKVSSEVSGLLAEAKSSMERSNAATRKLEEFQEGWEKLANAEVVTEDTVSEAMLLVDVAQKNLVEALEGLKDAEKALLAVNGLDVSEDMRTYVEMKREALGEQEKMLELELRGITVRVQAISEPESDVMTERLAEYEKQLMEIDKEAREHAVRAQTLHIDANDFYDERIGE